MSHLDEQIQRLASLTERARKRCEGLAELLEEHAQLYHALRGSLITHGEILFGVDEANQLLDKITPYENIPGVVELQDLLM